MFFSNTIALGLASLAATASASSLEVNNFGQQSIWVTLVNSTQSFWQAEIKSGTAFEQDAITGKGNSLGITTSPDYYSSSVPKFILGTTIDNSRLWWSVSHVDGDPFAGHLWNITTPDSTGANVCDATAAYDGKGHSCPDGDFTLTVNPYFNE